MTELFALVYLTFNILYYILAPQGAKLIYSILDWGQHFDTALTYTLVTLLVLIPLFALVHFAAFR